MDMDQVILVTGGNGAIGQFVIEELATRGHTVVSLSRRPGEAMRGVTPAAADVRDLSALIVLMNTHHVGCVIHLAALLLECEADPHLGFAINSLGTTNILEAARRTGVARVVNVGTKAAFGPFTGDWGYPTYRPVAEDHPQQPIGMYGLSKTIGEEMAVYYRRRFGMEVVTVRFGTSSGPGRGARHGASVITSAIIENAVKGIPTVIAQGGDEKDDIIYTRDVARGIVLAAITPGLTQPAYHLGSGELITLHDLARAVISEIPQAQISIGPGLDYMGLGIGNYCLMSTALARKELGFEPRYSLEEWVREYVGIVRSGRT